MNGLWPGAEFVQKYPEVGPVLDAVWDMGKTIEAGCEKISPIYCLQKLSFPLSVV